MPVLAWHILRRVSRTLMEPVVNTTIVSSAPSAPPNVWRFTPADMTAIYNGAQLVLGGPPGIITAINVTATTFDVAFAPGPPPPPPGLDRYAGVSLDAPTFPLGYPEKQLFTQAQMLGWLAEAQNMFLLHVRSYFVVARGVAIKEGERYYDQVNETIRLERISVDQKALLNESQTDLDRGRPRWMAESGYPPKHWFQDKINIARYGFDLLPSRNGTCDLWYSSRGPMPVQLLDRLLVPFPMQHILKYGVLSRAFSSESEIRDENIAKYCEQRFRFGVNLALRFMGEIEAAAAQVPAKAFNISPMQIPQGGAE